MMSPLLHDLSAPGRTREKHRFRRLDICLVEARDLRAISRSAQTAARDLLSHGDAAALGQSALGDYNAGWSLVDPRPISADMARYAEFIGGSRGEFTVAKDIYVRSNSGWFSDRSACYLAAGRPVVTMRTGLATSIRSGADCSNIPHTTTHSPASMRSLPTTLPTVERRGSSRANISLLIAFLARYSPLSGCRPAKVQLDRCSRIEFRSCDLEEAASLPDPTMDAFATSLVAKPLTAGVSRAAPRSQELDRDTFWDRLSFGIIVLGAVLALLTFRDYGVTWDEDAHNWYGNFVLDCYVSFLQTGMLSIGAISTITGQSLIPPPPR